MDSNYKPYSYVDSQGRIRAILSQADIEYEEVDALPDRDWLTYTNGFYANCAALFVDIRGSSNLPAKYRRPTLARIYRAYVSEVVAILNSTITCREVNIVGDGAWAIYNTKSRPHIDDVFAIAATVYSMIRMLNKELGTRSIDGIEVGIGMSWGRALMVKAGFKGSGLDDVVYMGDVVNEAAKLASFGNRTFWDRTLMASGDFHHNLNDHNKGLLAFNATRQCWHGDVIHTAMDAWLEGNT